VIQLRADTDGWKSTFTVSGARNRSIDYTETELAHRIMGVEQLTIAVEIGLARRSTFPKEPIEK
jgi:hypothetical protein